MAERTMVDNTEVDRDNKVDVTLHWNDFFFALEESRHQCVRATGNRDWFRLNPLEIVFLGCESIVNNGFAKHKLGTIVVGIEDINAYIYRMPRIFHYTLQILATQMTSNGCSTFMWQKCWKLIYGMSLQVKKYPRLNLHMMQKQSEMSHKFLEGSKNQPVDIRNQVEILAAELKQYQEKAKMLCKTMNLGTLQVENDIHLQIGLLVEDFGEYSVSTIWNDLGIQEFLEDIMNFVDDSKEFLIQLIFVIEVFLEALQHGAEAMKNDCGEADADSQEIMKIKKSFHEGTSTIRKWLEQFPNKSTIPSKILSYLFIALCSNDFTTGKADEFLKTVRLNEAMDALITFAVDGNRSKQSSVILENAIELMISSCECGESQLKVLMIHLPNLLGPVFGHGDGRLLCKALEYGSLALRSKHKKSLLGEGLWFMQKAHSQFCSIEHMSEHVRKCNLRIESVSVGTTILEDILSAVLKSKEEGNNPISDGQFITGTNKNQLLETSIQEDEPDCVYKDLDFQQTEAAEQNEIVDILYLMYGLACAIVKNGDNICYTFASVLPKLFQPTYLPMIPKHLPSEFFSEFQTATSHIQWRVNKNSLAIKVLKLCMDCTEYRSSSSFQICSVMIPKLVMNLNTTMLTDEEKLTALIEFVETCQSKADEHESVNALIGHGIDLISLLMPKGLKVDGLKEFLPSILKSLEKILNSTSLLFLRNSCNFFMNSFPAENEQLKSLFFKLLQKGKKNEIRNIHLLSAEWIKDPRFHFVLESLYKYEKGIFKAKQLQSLCEILTCIADMEKKLKTQLEDNLKSNGTQNEKKFQVRKLSQPFLVELEATLNQNGIDGNTQRSIMDKVSYMTLYNTLYQNEVLQHLTKASSINEDININTKLPNDVIKDVEIMKLLLTSARRIEHMQLPRFNSLKLLLTDILKRFLEDHKKEEVTEKLSESEEENVQTKLKEQEDEGPELRRNNRIMKLDSYLREIPANRNILKRLQDCGYKTGLFSEDISITVQTSGSLNVEENLRLTLLASFIGYLELLKQLGIPVIKIDEKDVKLEEVFSNELTLTDLKGRRAVVVKVIEKHASRNQQPGILDRKLTLLSDEERIESEMEVKASAKLRPKLFKVKLNVSFFDCAACCGPQIVGCYAPNGDHCERPLEIGMRYDSAFASIYDENDVEIENAEMLFMDQGVYLFRAYSNGHPYDTSQVWIAFFEELLEKREFVPAIILSHHMPNRHTWETIRRTVPTALTGMILSGEFDFSTEWRSYYDCRPESVRCGKDIVLLRGFKSSKYHPRMQRQFSVNATKDLGAMIFDNVMQELVKDEMLQEFRFLGGAIAEYISDMIETGRENPEKIASQFNFERWLKKKDKGEVTSTKTAIIERICSLIKVTVNAFISEVNLEDMFESRRRQFFQLKRFIEKKKSACEAGIYGNVQSQISNVLKTNTKTVKIDKLPLNVQEEVMHWIFGNEDRVWRYRGGRDGYETIHQYLRFLSHVRNENTKDTILLAFPGVLILAKREGIFQTETIQVKDIAGYAVGEYVDELDKSDEEEKDEDDDIKDITSTKHYEIVTAWVNPDYRRLNLSTQLYLEIFKSVTSPTVAFDVIKGSTAKVVESSPILKLLTFILPPSVTVKAQQNSYNVVTNSAEEQFERLVINRRPVKAAIVIYERLWRLFEHKHFILIPLIISVVAYFFFIYFNNKI